MGDWVLRTEGVNLDDTVFNVNALSVLRGASLVLETFGYELDAELRAHGIRFSRVYLASSQAVFLLKDCDRAAAEAARQIVLARLAKPQKTAVMQPALIVAQGGTAEDDLNLQMPSEHMTFVTTLAELSQPVNIPAQGQVSKADEMVLAAGLALARRMAQRAQIALPNLPPSYTVRVAGAGVKARIQAQCQIDPHQQVPETNELGACVWMPSGKYPEAKEIVAGKNGSSLQLFSRRSAHLLKYGQKGRKQLYDVFVHDERYKALMACGLDSDFAFAESFPDITGDANFGVDLPPSLSGKLAVLYIDGNGFTKRAADHPVAFPAAVKAIYDDLFFTLIGAFLEGAKGAQGAAWHNPDVLVHSILKNGQPKLHPLRIETLFVGGDDACLIFPAWLAFDMAELAMKTLQDSARQHGADFTPTFRAGLAIADSGTPFRRIRNLAVALMDDAKAVFPPKVGKEDNAIDAVSICIVEGSDLRDSGAESLKALRGEHFGNEDAGKGFRYALDQFITMRGGMRELKAKEAGLAKSVLHKVIKEIDGQDNEAAAFDKALKYHQLRGESPIKSGNLLAALPGQTGLPLALRLKVAAEFWDYADPMMGNVA